MNSLVITLFDHTCLGPFIKLGRLHKQVNPPTWIKILGGFIWEHQSTTQVFCKFLNLGRLLMLFFPLEKNYWKDLFENTVNDTSFCKFLKVVYVIPPTRNNILGGFISTFLYYTHSTIKYFEDWIILPI